MYELSIMNLLKCSEDKKAANIFNLGLTPRITYAQQFIVPVQLLIMDCEQGSFDSITSKFENYTPIQDPQLEASQYFEPKNGDSEDSYISDEGPNKKVEFNTAFECKSTDANYDLVIARFAHVFNLNPQFKGLAELSFETLNFIKKFVPESLTASTMKNQFTRSFSKIAMPPIDLNLPKSKRLWVTIIAERNLDDTYQFKLLNRDGELAQIICFVQDLSSKSYLAKTIEKRAPLKNLDALIFFGQEGMFPQLVNLLEYLLLGSSCQFLYLEAKKQKSLVFDGSMFLNSCYGKVGETPVIIYNSRNLIISNQEISEQDLESIPYYYNNYLAINDKFSSTVNNTSRKEIVFHKNQLYIQYYGALYNFIAIQSLEKYDFEEIQKEFLEALLREKVEKVNKMVQNHKEALNKRSLGHYPEKLPLSASKNCCVCEGKRKKKSKFRCELCTATYARDIVICLDHFKQYHNNPSQYIPKGVKQGTKKNEMKELEKSKALNLYKTAGKEGMIENEKITLEQIVKQWDTKLEQSGQVLANFWNLFYTTAANNASFMAGYQQIQGAGGQMGLTAKKEEHAVKEASEMM